MSAEPHASGPSTLADYRQAVAALATRPQPQRRPGFDELVGAEGIDREHDELAGAIERMGTAGLLTRARRAEGFVRSDGVTYGSTADGQQARNWSIDPLPVIVSEAQWSVLEAGLQQRIELLDALLQDFYGPRRLLRERLLPAPIVLGHPGFVRQADGIKLPGPRQLVLAATDVARASDGSWLVFGDRSEAPPGAGYAMATRRIVTRTLPAVHRNTGTRRLRGFFHTVRAALHDAAPPTADAPRVVMLSPGSASRTAFDQAFLATLLGIPLVEADDVVMKDGRVWMRTPGEDQPVDVVLRRVAADWADPLELNSGSQLGVPGLIDSARRGQVSVVNPMGARVLENPGLMSFLPRLCQEVLGADLKLAQPESWWCGTESARQHVTSKLTELVIKPLGAADAESATRFGWLLDRAQAQQLRDRIEAQPWAWCAQEPLPNSTAPVITRAGIEPRRLVLRTFGVAHADGVQIMPGALGRVAGDSEQDVVSDREGALAKDVWVLADPGSWTAEEGGGRGRSTVHRTPPSAVAPRMADDLYWAGRYTERIEATARLLKVADDLGDDYASRPGSFGALAMVAMRHAVTMSTGIPSQADDFGTFDPAVPDQWAQAPQAHLRRLITDRATAGTVAFGVAGLLGAAQRVRDHLSLDTWPVLSRLEQTLRSAGDAESVQAVLGRVLESALALSGITQQSMIRDTSWAFVDLGGRIERAQFMLQLVRSTLAIEHSPVIEGQVVEAVLSAGESLITHRRRVAAGVGPAVPVQAAVELLVQDRRNPRSVAFQLARIAEDLRQIGDDQGRSEAERLAAQLERLDLDASARPDLDVVLSSAHTSVIELANGLAARHFQRKGTQVPTRTEWTLGKAGQGR